MPMTRPAPDAASRAALRWPIFGSPEKSLKTEPSPRPPRAWRQRGRRDLSLPESRPSPQARNRRRRLPRHDRRGTQARGPRRRSRNGRIAKCHGDVLDVAKWPDSIVRALRAIVPQRQKNKVPVAAGTFSGQATRGRNQRYDRIRPPRRQASTDRNQLSQTGLAVIALGAGEIGLRRLDALCRGRPC